MPPGVAAVDLLRPADLTGRCAGEDVDGVGQRKKSSKRVRPSGPVARLKRMPERVSISWMTVRPMPLPSGLVEKNGVKRLRAASSGMGKPLSEMHQ